jgi:hypothetical protein
MDRAISPPAGAIVDTHQESIIRAHSPSNYERWEERITRECRAGRPALMP